VETDNKLIRTIEFWTLLFGTRSRNCIEDVSTHGTNRLLHYIDCLSCSDRYLFVMKSRRKSVAQFVSRLIRRRPDSRMPRCLATTSPLRIHSERLINNTKQSRQTNIAFGFTGDTRVLVALLPYRKLLYRANTPSYSLVDLSVGMLQASSKMIGSRRKADKDQTPAIYLSPLARRGRTTLSSVLIVTFSRLPFRFVGLVLLHEAFNTIFLVLVMPRCNLT